MRTMMKSKIHRVRVTDLNIDYEGSITIDRNLMEAADILPYEQVHILNVNNGERFLTYAIKGEANSGEICINGAAARLVCKGDIVIILTYTQIDNENAENFKPTVVYVNKKNEITSVKRSVESLTF
ncbi:MAG: aspartate 1-decarboxylase [Dehalococcoidales bacterium]